VYNEPGAGDPSFCYLPFPQVARHSGELQKGKGKDAPDLAFPAEHKGDNRMGKLCNAGGAKNGYETTGTHWDYRQMGIGRSLRCDEHR